MPIAQDRLARGMTMHKAMRMGFDEALVALREAIADLTDEQFQRYHVPGRHNMATIVMHCLQQVDDFNGNLQLKRGIPGPVREWHYLPSEERFGLWGLPEEKLPRSGQPFPTVAKALDMLDTMHRVVLENMDAISEEEFINTPVGPWPRLCDIFFRSTYHIYAHIRQLWLIRGHLGLAKWPAQHFA